MERTAQTGVWTGEGADIEQALRTLGVNDVDAAAVGPWLGGDDPRALAVRVLAGANTLGPGASSAEAAWAMALDRAGAGNIERICAVALDRRREVICIEEIARSRDLAGSETCRAVGQRLMRCGADAAFIAIGHSAKTDDPRTRAWERFGAVLRWAGVKPLRIARVCGGKVHRIAPDDDTTDWPIPDPLQGRLRANEPRAHWRTNGAGSLTPPPGDAQAFAILGLQPHHRWRQAMDDAISAPLAGENRMQHVAWACRHLTRRWMEHKIERDKPIGSANRAGERVRAWLHAELGGETRERVLALYLDGRYRMLAVHEEAADGAAGASVDAPAIARRAMVLNAAAIILAHVHPSGDTSASYNDIEVTKRLARSLDAIGVVVLDHVIVGCGETLSMAESGMEWGGP